MIMHMLPFNQPTSIDINNFIDGILGNGVLIKDTTPANKGLCLGITLHRHPLLVCVV